jgi:hypothetical protein
MFPNPVTVEIQVDREGCFVKVVRIYMLPSVEGAKDFSDEKIREANKLFEEETNLDYMSLHDNGVTISGSYHAK